MFIRYPSKKAEIPIRHIVPNLVTTIALCCGLAAIHSSMQSEFKEACLFVAASAIFDTLDGLVARRLRATSSFGSVLDSLSDFLSFGIAPAIIIYQWLLTVDRDLKVENLFGVIPFMLFALCSALRLARFTAAAHAKPSLPGAPVQAHPPHSPQTTHAIHPTPAASTIASMFFVGIPTPAAAGVVLIPVLLSVSKLGAKYSLTTPTAVVMTLTVFVALFMVSRQPMFSIKKLRFSRTSVVPLFLCVGVIMIGVIRDLALTVAIMAGVYLLTLPIAIMKHRSLTRKAQLEAVEFPEGQPSPT